MEQAYQGMAVEDVQGHVGTVVGVGNDPATGATRLVVETATGERRTLTSEMFTVRDNIVYVNETSTNLSTSAGYQTQPLDRLSAQLDVAEGAEVRIPVIREEAVITTRPVERGGVRVHKRVNERTETIEQPTSREHVDVERIAIGRVIEGNDIPHTREEGDTLIIPVLEEMIVVEKRLVLKEEIRITKRRSQDVEQVQVVLREEAIDIEPITPDPLATDQIEGIR